MIYNVFVCIFCIFLYIIMFKIIFFRITDYLIVNRFTKKIHQSIKLRKRISNNFKDNIKPKNIIKLDKDILKSITELEDYFGKTKIKKFKVYTNEKMNKRLLKLQGQGIIKLKYISSKKNTIKRQPIERIILLGIYTLIRNLFNKNYWEYVKVEEQMYTYEIIVI